MHNIRAPIFFWRMKIIVYELRPSLCLKLNPSTLCPPPLCLSAACPPPASSVKPLQQNNIKKEISFKERFIIYMQMPQHLSMCDRFSLLTLLILLVQNRNLEDFVVFCCDFVCKGADNVVFSACLSDRWSGGLS